EVYKFDATLGWQAMPALPSMSVGWDAPQNYTTIQCGDVDGDGKAELIGRSGAGIEIYQYDASAGWVAIPFPRGETGGGLWSDAAGWNQPQNYSTIQCADIDGDGQDELVGRGGQGLEAYKYNAATKSWSKLPGLLSGWRDDFSWNQVQYYATIQSARVLKYGDFGYIGDGKHTQAALLGRGKLGMQTYSYSGGSVGWEQAPAGFAAFTPGQQSAFEKLDAVLRPSLPPDHRGSAGNIRGSYNDKTFFANGLFREWQNRMFSSRPDHGYTGVRPPLNPNFAPAPAGIDPNDWADVCWQVYWELEWVQDVYVWYGAEQFGGLINSVAIKKLQILPKIANHLTEKEEGSVTTELVVKIIEIFTKGVELFLTDGASLFLNADEEVGGNLGFAASVAGQIISSLTTYSEPNNAKAFTVAYNKLQDELDTAFDAAVAGNEANKFRLTGGWVGTYFPADLGRMRQISEWMKDGTWSWTTGPDGGTTSILLANLSRGFAVYVWQALYAAAKPWYVFNYQKNNGANIPENFPAKYVWFNNWLGRPRLFLSTIVPSEKALSDWFDPVVSNQTFPLGVPFSDVYLGQHGWIFSQRFDTTQDQYSPASGVDMRTTVELSRDADTGELLASVTLDNEGMTPATNVEITSATLGNQPAVANHSLQQIQVHTDNEQNAVLTFPGLPSGTRTVLRISGRYLGGTFGTSLRITLP
ncbi:MAG: VCBS repeat-containing protein, partial [Armatimonadota bacterium]